MNEIKVHKNSVKEIHQHLQRKYNQAVIEVEMKLYQGRKTRNETRLRAYLNATRLHHGFAFWMMHSYYDNKHYTISQLVKEMYSTRQSISLMISECEAEGWIKVIRTNNSVKCTASQPMVEGFEKFMLFRRNEVKSVIGYAFQNLNNFEKLMSKDFTQKDE